MDLIRASKMGIVNDRKIVKCLNHLLRMMCHLRSIAKTWTMMARGLVIWYCKQLLLLHGVTFAFIGTCHLAGYIRNFDQPGACMIHLSYHDEEHYNSVRLKEDTGDGPARPIAIKADSNLSSSSCQAKAGSNKSKLGAGKDITDAGSIKLVMAGSGCENIEKVEQTLLQMYGDVDAAIEYLIAEKGIEDFSEETVETVPSPCYVDASHGNSRDQALESRKSRKEKKRGKRGSDTSALSSGSDGGPPDMGPLCI